MRVAAATGNSRIHGLHHTLGIKIDTEGMAIHNFGVRWLGLLLKAAIEIGLDIGLVVADDAILAVHSHSGRLHAAVVQQKATVAARLQETRGHCELQQSVEILLFVDAKRIGIMDIAGY